MLSSLQTVRVWQGSENGNYDCRHVLKDHTAEVINLISANENISSLFLLVILIVPLIALVKHALLDKWMNFCMMHSTLPGECSELPSISCSLYSYLSLI